MSMNNQNTPVHINLWHKDFWLIALTHLFLSVSVYMFIPVLPLWLLGRGTYTFVHVGRMLFAFTGGLWLLGVFCSYLVQRYRRNVVCVMSIFLLIISTLALHYEPILSRLFPEVPVVELLRLLSGACFGLAQMVLGSTLINDTCESFLRTEANHSASWFQRFSLALGPLLGIVVYSLPAGFDGVLLVSSAFAVAAALLILSVHFPFRAPDESVKRVSLDRFFLPHSFPLYLNLLPVIITVGLLLSLNTTVLFYCMIMCGFLLALVCQRFVFPNADLRSEVVSGLILLLCAILLYRFVQVQTVYYVAPLFIGVAYGLIGARFLLYFIRLSKHCQRGTAQSTYMLVCESGLFLGMGIGYGMFGEDSISALNLCMCLVGVSLLLYHFYVHQWFISHKNR